MALTISVSLAYGGGKVWSCVTSDFATDSENVIELARINGTTLAVEQFAVTNLGSSANWGFSGFTAMAVGYAEGQTDPLILAQRVTSAGTPTRIRRATFTGASLVFAAGSLNTTYTANTRWRSILWDDGFDFGDSTPRYVLCSYTADSIVFNASTGVENTNERFGLGFTGDRIGMIWNGSQFKALSTTGALRSYEDTDVGLAQSDPLTQKWISQSYARFGSPAYETQQSTKYVFPSFPKRSKLTITGAPLPASPSATEPTHLAFYMGSGATEPADVDMWQQGALAAGDTTITYDDPFLTSGTAHPNTGTAFPSSGVQCQTCGGR